jgi:hypothetical protein
MLVVRCPMPPVCCASATSATGENPGLGIMQ